MDYLTSILFLYLLLIFLWVIKADFMLVILAIAFFLFLLIFNSFQNPIEMLSNFYEMIYENPQRLLLILIPISIHLSVLLIKKKISKQTRKLNH